MIITQVFDSKHVFRVLRSQEKQLGMMVYTKCFQLQTTESVLILADEGKRDEAIILFEAAKDLCLKRRLVMIEGMTENGQEPSAEVVKLILESDVALLVTTYSLSHTRGRQQASDFGVRIASLPGITEDMMVRTLSADYEVIKKESNRLAQILSSAQTAKLTSPGGTSLTFSLFGRTGVADIGELHTFGAFGNLPAGEAFIAPVEGTTQGVLVVDGCQADLLLDAPITVHIQDGCAVKVEGGVAAHQLENSMKEVGQLARIVAELGIGTNKNALATPTSDVLEAEKAYGTCHVAFGDNASIGGVNDVPFHSDGVILKPTLICDGIVVMKDGVFV